MTETDREMLVSIYWILKVFTWIGCFYIGYLIAEWWKKKNNKVE